MTPSSYPKDFQLTKTTELKELSCTLKELLHIPSGACIIHIENNDPENLFCLSFPTLPKNSNGAAHILEHTVLCGSKKYPIKDPFFCMIRRSLNTFMNAMTGSDFTCYPAASQVEKDFYNLLDVYIDAVFHPELKKMSFLQEGHRLEFANTNDSKTPLEWKGIVFNEMKGALNSPESRLWQELMKYLTPDLPYAHLSGGDPKEIPSLTYEELILFHEEYYHPSRCLFFFYGNIPTFKHLGFLEKTALKNAENKESLKPIPSQKRFEKPLYKEIKYPIGEGEDLTKKTIVSFAWLTAPIKDQETILALQVIDTVLMETDASLLKAELLKSGLCVSADSQIDTEISEVPYVIVCKGCEEKDVDQLEKCLKEALEKIITNGIPLHLIESAIHQLEFERTEITGDHGPFGLYLFMRSALLKQHGCSAESGLKVHSLFDNLLEKIKDPSYLTGLIDRFIYSNPHFVRLTLIPDPLLLAQEIQEEKAKLEAIKNNLTEEEKNGIVAQGKKLKTFQKQLEKQSIECLPKVNLEDIPLEMTNFKLEEKENVFYHNSFTNHILYADLVFDMPAFTEDELPFVKLFSTILPEIGSKDRNYAQNLEYLQAHVGGLSTGLYLYPQTKGRDALKPGFVLRGKALHRKAPELFSAMLDMTRAPCLNEKKRIEELILQIQNELQNRKNKNALNYATLLSLSSFSQSAHINQAWHGLPYLKKIQEVSSGISQNYDAILEKLVTVKDKLFSAQKPALILTCDTAMRQTLEKENYYGLFNSTLFEKKSWDNSYKLSPAQSQAHMLPSQVAFTCMAYKVATYTDPVAPALTLATQIMENKVLHPQIREQGGAYGSGATYNALNGYFTFHSYRDPHISSSIQAFREAITAVAEGRFDARDLEEAKLEVIQSFDAPISPGSRGSTAYTWQREGKTFEKRNHYRSRILALTSSEIQQAVQSQLLTQIESGTITTFAGKDLLKKEQKSLEKMEKCLPIIES